jgi:hypothetical protein
MFLVSILAFLLAGWVSLNAEALATQGLAK